jgi:hypothetical protein
MKFYLTRWTHLAQRPMILNQRSPKIGMVHQKSRFQIVRNCEKLFKTCVYPCTTWRLSARLSNAQDIKRKIRIRLHGTRLPKDYTIILRMDKSTDFARPIREGPKRRRRHPSRRPVPQAPSTSDSESPSPPPDKQESRGKSTPQRSESESQTGPAKNAHADDTHTVDFEIQRNNAYPGSSNTIGSIHQRRWYLSLDRESSGFEPTIVRGNQSEGVKATGKRTWIPKLVGKGFEPFYVRGPEAERSLITARLGVDVLDDEGVKEFVPRRGWRPVLH